MTEVEPLDPQRPVFRLTLSSPLPLVDPTAAMDAPSTVIVKQQKINWEDEFKQEIQAYEKLKELQGTVIPIFYGQGSFNDLDARVSLSSSALTLFQTTYNSLPYKDSPTPKLAAKRSA
ncbi:hypothetical protein ACN38_g6954, partial [Penicillium nordicum]